VLVLVIVVVSVLWQNDKQTNYVFVCLAWAQKKKKMRKNTGNTEGKNPEHLAQGSTAGGFWGVGK